MMYIPLYVRNFTRRLAEEYERMYICGEGVYDSITCGLKVYKGRESTKRCAEVLRKLCADYETQKGIFFESQCEEDNMINIMKFILSHETDLDEKASRRVFNEVNVSKRLQKYLEHETRKGNDDPEFLKLSEYVSNALYTSWSEVDSLTKYKYFELITSENEFRSIMEKNSAYCFDLTGEDKTFQKMKIIYVWIPEDKQMQDKHILRKFNKVVKRGNIWETELFNIWSHIGPTGVYYIYIQTDKVKK